MRDGHCPYAMRLLAIRGRGVLPTISNVEKVVFEQSPAGEGGAEGPDRQSEDDGDGEIHGAGVPGGEIQRKGCGRQYAADKYRNDPRQHTEPYNNSNSEQVRKTSEDRDDGTLTDSD